MSDLLAMLEQGLRNHRAGTLNSLSAVRSAPSSVHLMIGTPCFGGNLTDHYALSLLKLQAACIERGIRLSFCLLHGDALITRARNSVVAEFLQDRSASHLLFIDADIGFQPSQVFRLLEADREMAGAAYPVKLLDWQRIGRAARAGGPLLTGRLVRVGTAVPVTRRFRVGDH